MTELRKQIPSTQSPPPPAARPRPKLVESAPVSQSLPTQEQLDWLENQPRKGQRSSVWLTLFYVLLTGLLVAGVAAAYLISHH